MAEEAAIDLTIRTGDAEKATQSVKARIKEIKAALLDLDEGSEEFTKLSEEAGRLTDKIGDINQRVNHLASDTKKLDAFVGVAKGIAGGFAAAQGAMALFGAENEDLNKTLLKVQGSVAFLNGVQEIANTLNEDSAAMVSLNAAAQAGYSIVVGTSTGALKLFRIALAATGIGLAIIAVAALVENWDKLAEAIGGSNEKLKDWERLNETTSTAIKLQDEATQQKIRYMQLGNATEEEILKRRIYGNELAIGLAEEELAAAKEVEKAGFANMEEMKKNAEAQLSLTTLIEDRKLQNLEFQKKYNKDLIAAYKQELQEEAEEEDEANKKQQAAAKEAAIRKLENLIASKNLELDRLRLFKEDTKAVEAEIYDALIELAKLKEEDLTNVKLDAEKSRFERVKQMREEQAAEEAEIEKMRAEQKLADEQAARDKAQAQVDKAAAMAKDAQAEYERQQDIDTQKARDRAAIKIQLEQNVFNSLSSISNSLANLGKKNEKLQKALAIAQIAIDTAKAISAAIASVKLAVTPLDYGLQVAAAIGIVAVNIATAAKLLGTKNPADGATSNAAGVSSNSIAAPEQNNAPGIPPSPQSIPVPQQIFVTETDITGVQGQVNVIEGLSEIH